VTSARHSSEHSSHNIPNKSHIRHIAQNYVNNVLKLCIQNINPQKPSSFKYSVGMLDTSVNRLTSSQIAKLAKQVPNIGLQNEQTGVLLTEAVSEPTHRSNSCCRNPDCSNICKALSGLPPRKIWFQLDGFSFLWSDGFLWKDLSNFLTLPECRAGKPQKRKYFYLITFYMHSTVLRIFCRLCIFVSCIYGLCS
jgi:hypothetical protein